MWLLLLSPCVSVSKCEHLCVILAYSVVETTTVAGTTTEADLSAFADVDAFVYLSQ